MIEWGASVPHFDSGYLVTRTILHSGLVSSKKVRLMDNWCLHLTLRQDLYWQEIGILRMGL